MRECLLVRPAGLVPYDTANDAMHMLAAHRAADDIPDVLILLEHPPVFTTGPRADPAHLRWTDREVAARGAELREIDRGGSFTFHGPGQLVGYPVFKLASRLDIVPHLRAIETAVIAAGADLGIALHRSKRQTGVWSGAAKVCAIGVRLTAARVTLHGFGLNCTTDLSWFEGIVPCGLADAGVTSLSVLAGRTIGVDEAAPMVAGHFAEQTQHRLREAPPDVEAMFGAGTSARAG